MPQSRRGPSLGGRSHTNSLAVGRKTASGKERSVADACRHQQVLAAAHPRQGWDLVCQRTGPRDECAARPANATTTATPSKRSPVERDPRSAGLTYHRAAGSNPAVTGSDRVRPAHRCPTGAATDYGTRWAAATKCGPGMSTRPHGAVKAGASSSTVPGSVSARQLPAQNSYGQRCSPMPGTRQAQVPDRHQGPTARYRPRSNPRSPRNQAPSSPSRHYA
jgi:hypothetical protein